jgi:hypothetical protein
MLLPGEPAQVLLANSLVDGGATADSLPVVVRRVRPPVSLHLHVPKPNNSLSISRISIRQLPTVYYQSPEGR